MINDTANNCYLSLQIKPKNSNIKTYQIYINSNIRICFDVFNKLSVIVKHNNIPSVVFKALKKNVKVKVLNHHGTVMVIVDVVKIKLCCEMKI